MKRVYSINIGQMNMKNIWIIRIAACLLLLSVSTSVFAQEFRQNWEKKVFAAYNLGGTSPLPIPAEIRKINYWKPGFGGTLAFHLTRWLDANWGVTTGLAIDLKGMKVEADVKYLYTSLVVGEGDHAGKFTGTFSGKFCQNLQNSLK